MMLSVENLSKSFGGVTAVDNAQFDLAAGETRALIGPNGAGKSTFVGMVAGRIAPDRGRVIFDGDDITALPAHRRIRKGMAYTFQITSIYPRLTVAENVALAGDADVLGQVGLADRAGQTAGDLSYGHQRVLEIAMGLASRPKLLILDEPTQGLAEGEIAVFNDIIRSLSDTTVLLIEHNMDVVMALAEQITVLVNGSVMATGSPEEIQANAAVQAAYLGTGDAAA